MQSPNNLTTALPGTGRLSAFLLKQETFTKHPARPHIRPAFEEKKLYVMPRSGAANQTAVKVQSHASISFLIVVPETTLQWLPGPRSHDYFY